MYFSNLKIHECFLRRNHENGFGLCGPLIPRISSIYEVFRASLVCQEMHQDVSVIFVSNSGQMHGTDLCSLLGWSSCLPSPSPLSPPGTPLPQNSNNCCLCSVFPNTLSVSVWFPVLLVLTLKCLLNLIFLFFPSKPTKSLKPSLSFTLGQSVQTILKQHCQKYFLKTHIQSWQNSSSSSSDPMGTH